MYVFLNNNKKTITEGQTLGKLMEELNMRNTKGIAIAINDQVIPQDKCEKYQLKNNDSILLITATQGG